MHSGRFQPPAVTRHALAIACLLLACLCQAGEAARTPTQAIQLGLGWLRGQQQPDGSVTDPSRTAATGLAALAHLAAGVTPDQPEHGPAVRRMLVYLTGRGDERGYLGAGDGRMYGHAIACLALANALGTSRDDDLDERLRQTLTRGIAVIVDAARVPKSDGHQGGWFYEPNGATCDVSVSGWQLAALYAARRTGLSVPDDVFSGAIAFIRARIDDDGKVGYAARGEDHQALRGVALFALDLQPGARDPLRDKILARMRAEPPAWAGPWFFYRSYYDATCLSRCEPTAWPAVRDKLYPLLVANQSPDGSWPAPPGDNERDYGISYATCMALLALGVEQRLLPSN